MFTSVTSMEQHISAVPLNLPVFPLCCAWQMLRALMRLSGSNTGFVQQQLGKIIVIWSRVNRQVIDRCQGWCFKSFNVGYLNGTEKNSAKQFTKVQDFSPKLLGFKCWRADSWATWLTALFVFSLHVICAFSKSNAAFAALRKLEGKSIGYGNKWEPEPIYEVFFSS